MKAKNRSMLGAVALLMMGATAPANAAIECRDGNQYNTAANAWIASSYCGDELIAQVARARGMNVTGKAVRQNPFVKDQVCRFASSDIRINGLCSGHRPEDGGSSLP